MIKIFSTRNPNSAEIIRQILKENKIEAAILNKQDSSYRMFDSIDIYIDEKQLSEAKNILKNIDHEIVSDKHLLISSHPVRASIARLLSVITQKHIPISFKLWNKKMQIQYLRKQIPERKLNKLIEKYRMGKQLNTSEIKKLSDSLKKNAVGHGGVSGGIIGFAIGMIFSPPEMTGFAAWTGMLVLGVISSIIWRFVGVKWFISGIKDKYSLKQ